MFALGDDHLRSSAVAEAQFVELLAQGRAVQAEAAGGGHASVSAVFHRRLQQGRLDTLQQAIVKVVVGPGHGGTSRTYHHNGKETEIAETDASSLRLYV